MIEFSEEDRAVACIQAVAVGDAMGKMTEGFWPEEILSTYGERITHFRDPLHPRGSKKGRRQERWRYAEVTDDTSFTRARYRLYCRGKWTPRNPYFLNYSIEPYSAL